LGASHKQWVMGCGLKDMWSNGIRQQLSLCFDTGTI
jgi:hypothetical protein